MVGCEAVRLRCGMIPVSNLIPSSGQRCLTQEPARGHVTGPPADSVFTAIWLPLVPVSQPSSRVRSPRFDGEHQSDSMRQCEYMR